MKRLVDALLLGQVVCLTIFLSFTTSGNYFWFSTTKGSPRQANCSCLEQKLWHLWMLFIRPGGCSVSQFFFSLTTSGNFLIFNHQGICKTSKLPLSWNEIWRHLWMLFYWARWSVSQYFFSFTTSGNCFWISTTKGSPRQASCYCLKKRLWYLWVLFYWARLVVCLTNFLQFNHFWKLFDFQTPRDLQHEQTVQKMFNYPNNPFIRLH